MIRLLVSDIDGTLVTKDKILTPAVRAAAESLAANGIKLVLTSSRPPHGVALFADALGLDTPRGAFNGGAMVSPAGDVLSFKTIEAGTAREALAYLRDAGIDPWVFTADAWLMINPLGDYVDWERRTVKMPFRVVEGFDPVPDGIGKIMAASKDFAKLAECERVLQERLAGRASVHLSQQYYLDITHPDANKGEAVRQASRLLGVPLEETACIGDMTNDLPMFEVARFRIAMGNAPAGMKALADFVSGSNEEDGWAQAVSDYILRHNEGAG